jgi:MerR family Zn(II)-responsive transcriptional regulator of zntA
MRQVLSISELAKSAGVTSKTLRHWEGFGLLPKATRTHTGYRVFDPQTTHYVDFIQKSKTVGLTLKEVKRVLELARKGKNPCPEVVKWVDEKAMAVEQQIQTLKALQKRLNEFRHICSTSSVMTCSRPGELCCLIEDLPNPKSNGGNHAKVVRARSRRVNNLNG